MVRRWLSSFNYLWHHVCVNVSYLSSLEEIAMTPRKPAGPTPANLSRRQLEVSIPKLQRRIDDLKAFSVESVVMRSDPRIEALEKKVDATLSDIFGPDSYEFTQYGHTQLDTMPIAWGGSGWSALEVQANVRENVQRAILKLQTLVDLFGERLSDSEDAGVDQQAIKANPIGNRVFVVHGHDDGMKETVARFLERLGLEGVILHEQPNNGRTIIEKFEANARVDFAVVLFSPDDVGYAKNSADKATPRARQNVVLELGFFMGALGRHKVCALVQPNIEKPSDYDGVLFVPFDSSGSWRLLLAKEMKASGMEVDLNRVI